MFQKFREGDKVRDLKTGAEGVVVDYYAEPYDPTTQEPVVRFPDGQREIYVYESQLEFVEDPYEYAVQRTLVDGPGASMIVGEFWNTLDEVNTGLLNLSTRRTEYTLVKRLKAGKIEKA